MDDLKRQLQTILTQFGLGRTYWVGYSGGLDSEVLLYCCSKLFPHYSFQAIHIHHGLNQHADAWVMHCRERAAEYGIPLHIKHLTLPLEKGVSIEEVARNARYAAIAAMMGEGDVLLTAHHQDDQAETMLLQLLRGSGLKGLAAMPLQKVFAKGWHARPWLPLARVELEKVAKTYALKWIEDDSNQNAAFMRNFIRHELLPLLNTRLPTVTAQIARSAMHCAEAVGVLDEVAETLLARIKGAQANTLAISELAKLSAAEQRLVVRHWIQKSGYILPSSKKLAALLAMHLTAALDRQPLIGWDQVTVQRYRDDLYLRSALPYPPYRVAIDEVQGAGFALNRELVEIRYRVGGESLNLPGRGRRDLKRLFQEWGVPPWERERLPLVFYQGALLGVVGYAFASDYQAKPGEAGLLFRLE